MRRLAPPWTKALLIGGLGFALGASLVIWPGWFRSLGAVGAGLVMAALMAVVLYIGLVWWRSVDEAAREAHKSAWFWGANIALALGAVWLALAVTNPDLLPLPAGVEGESEAAAFASGAFVTLMVQAVGYAIAWAIWWLRRR